MNKTIYLRDEDVETWDRAREFSGDKLSPVIVSGLKRYVAEKELEADESKGFERIVLSFQDADDSLIPKKMAFTGKWIIPPQEPYDEFSEDGSEIDRFAVATTPKNSAVFYYWTEDGEHFLGKHFSVYPSLNTAAVDHAVRRAAIKAIEKIGVPIQELDI